MISTEDFYTFRVMPYMEKVLKIKTWHYSQENQYAMLSRIDGQQLSYVFRYSYSGTIRCTSGTRFPWEFTQMGIADLRFGLRKAGWSLPTVWEP
jgi:hypothetical protein